MATGEHGRAQLVARGIKGDSFEDACKRYFTGPLGKIRQSKWGGYDPKHNAIWACRLFDNLEDARRSFG